MQINLSEETIEVVYNSLVASRQSLRSQMRSAETSTHRGIISKQLEEVEEALGCFEELIEAF